MVNGKILFAVIILTITLASCGIRNEKAPPSQDAMPIKIGIVAPLTGAWATGGQGVSRGIELAAEELNSKRGAGDRRIEIMLEDSHSDLKDGMTSLQKLLSDDKINIVIGGVISAEAAAQAPAAQEAKKVLLSPTATTSTIETAGEWVFKLRESTRTHANATTEEIKKRGHKTIGVIYQNGETCNDFVASMRKSLEAAGIKVTAEEKYDPADKDMRSQLAKLGKTRSDALFECGLYEDIGLVLRQARELGIDQPIFTMVGAESKKLFEIAGNAADGIIFTSSKFSCEESPDFCEKFEKKFGSAPDYRSAFGYDAMMLAAEAIKRKGDTPEKIKEGLLLIQGYRGVTGETSFDTEGNAHKEVVVKQVKDKKFVTIG